MKQNSSTHERLADRLANILTLLNIGSHLSSKKLADQFGVNNRTIMRDFDRLSSYLPLQQDEITKKYYNSYEDAIADCKKEMEKIQCLNF